MKVLCDVILNNQFNSHSLKHTPNLFPHIMLRLKLMGMPMQKDM